MNHLKLTEKQKELVEAYGVIQENMGLNPAAARVNALLTVSNKTELTIITKPIKKYMYLYKPGIFSSFLVLSKKQDIKAIRGIKIGIPNLLLISALVSLRFFACRLQLCVSLFLLCMHCIN